MKPLRVLMVEPFPVPYFAPLHRALADRTDVEVKVAFDSLGTVTSEFVDSGFGTRLSWDVPLLDGYCWTDLSADDAPSRRSLVRSHDAIFISNYRTRSAARYWMLAVLHRKPVMFASDAIELAPQPAAFVRSATLRRLLIRALVRLSAGVHATSSRGVAFHRRLTGASHKVALVPYVADETVFTMPAPNERDAARTRYGVESGYVVGFVGKLIDRKRVHDVVEAVSRVPDATALIVGSGPLERELQSLAAALGVEERVRFAGFKNQSELRSAYTAMDVVVLPSDKEPFGLVVHEAELCGTLAVCTTACGAYDDLVAPVADWLGYVAGDVEALVSILRRLADATTRAPLTDRAAEVARAWNVHLQADSFVDAFGRAQRLHR